MKTTVAISDSLFERAKRYAKRTGRPMRALVEEGLRLVLDTDKGRPSYVLPDLSVGDERSPDPLEAISWQELRDQIYDGR